MHAIDYIKKAHDLNLSNHYQWHKLLHMTNGISEIDDEKFFLSKDGKGNAASEMSAMITALIEEEIFDDNATACKFPARTRWITKKLNMTHLPVFQCVEYQKILKKLDPTSATIVFPSAHINSPASMFGHTFLRINSSYHSKLLSYAINYAANVDERKTNGFLYALKGLTGGYQGFYSMLPYYEKLKEYRDSEQRDIWEYDLNLTQDEVLRMFEHIWELNGIYSDYYFFTENCSYNILWLLEIARDSIHLRDYFTYHVSPLETIHAMYGESMIDTEHYRASKRRILLNYENIIDKKNIHYVKELIHKRVEIQKPLNDKAMSLQEKRYIFEAAIELLEYQYMQGEITKKVYLNLFHQLTSLRATLGKGEILFDDKPVNPILSHRQARLTLGAQYQDNLKSFLIGIRPVYHDLHDNNRGLLRGTQIEFLNTLLSIKDTIKIEELTLLSIHSISQLSEFIKPFSWRAHFKWDRDYHDSKLHFNVDMGAGASWGNEYGYSYIMSDIYGYMTNGIQGAIGLSAGLVIDRGLIFKTNIELTKRWYYDGSNQTHFNVVQSYTMTQNTQFKFEYNYKKSNFMHTSDQRYRVIFNYYF